MRALRVDGSTTSLREVPMPAAGDEVRVRVTHSGICNTDLELARGYMGFRGTIGHEFVGVVDELGAAPPTLRVGQRVVGEIGSRCGRFAPALELLARGAVDLAPLVSDVVSLDRAERAMSQAATPGTLKVVLTR